MPKRIQRSRVKGWRMPEGAAYVGRGSRWGNPWKAEVVDGVGWCGLDPEGRIAFVADGAAGAHRFVVEQYRQGLEDSATPAIARQELRGKVLCCWCPPQLACHADVLLELANAEEE